MTPSECRWVELQTKRDPRGQLVIAEHGKELPFLVRRVYVLSGVPAGAQRGKHGHKALQQVFVAMHGSFCLVVDNGVERTEFALDSPTRGVYVGPMMWRELHGFSSDAVCAVLASLEYDESDYVYDYGEYTTLRARR